MLFLVDECAGPAVATWLRSESHDVFFVYDEARGMTDEQVLTKAFAEGRILITIDKDFGERVYRDQQPHCGVILLRLADQRSAIKIEALRKLITAFAQQLPNRFVTVSEAQVRFGA